MVISQQFNSLVLSLTLYRSDKDTIESLRLSPLKLGLTVEADICWLLLDGGRHLDKLAAPLNIQLVDGLDLDKLKNTLFVQAVTAIDEEVITKRKVELSPTYFALLKSALESQAASEYDEDGVARKIQQLDEDYDARKNLYGRSHILEEHL